MFEKINDPEQKNIKNKINFSKFSYSKKLEIKYFFVYQFILTGGLLLSFYLIMLGVSKMINEPRDANSLVLRDWVSFFIGSLFTLAMIGFFKHSDKILDNILIKYENAKRGRKGEELVVSELNKILDKNQYKIFLNVPIHGEKSDFDIDIIVIGPKGLLMFEVKNLRGNFHFVEKDVYKQNPFYHNYGCRLKKNPILQTINNKEVLRKILIKNGLGNIMPKSALVMVGSTISELSHPGVYVIIGVNKLFEYIKDLPDDSDFTSEFRDKIIKDLKLQNVYGEFPPLKKGDYGGFLN